MFLGKIKDNWQKNSLNKTNYQNLIVLRNFIKLLFNNNKNKVRKKIKTKIAKK